MFRFAAEEINLPDSEHEQANTIYQKLSCVAEEVLYLNELPVSSSTNVVEIRNCFHAKILDNVKTLNGFFVDSKQVNDEAIEILKDTIISTLEYSSRITEIETNAALKITKAKKIQKFLKLKEQLEKLFEQNKLTSELNSILDNKNLQIKSVADYITSQNIRKQEIYYISDLYEPCYICLNRNFRKKDGISHYCLLSCENLFSRYDMEVIALSKEDKRFKTFEATKNLFCCEQCFSLFHENVYPSIRKIYHHVSTTNDLKNFEEIHQFFSKLSSYSFITSTYKTHFLYFIKSISFYRYRFYSRTSNLQLQPNYVTKEEGVWVPKILSNSLLSFVQNDKKLKSLSLQQIVNRSISFYSHSPMLGFSYSTYFKSSDEANNNNDKIENDFDLQSPIQTLLNSLCRKQTQHDLSINYIHPKYDNNNVLMRPRICQIDNHNNNFTLFHYEGQLWLSYSLVGGIIKVYKEWIQKCIIASSSPTPQRMYVAMITGYTADAFITEITFASMNFGVFTFSTNMHSESKLQLVSLLKEYNVRILVLQNIELLRTIQNLITDITISDVIILENHITHNNNNNNNNKSNIDNNDAEVGCSYAVHRFAEILRDNYSYIERYTEIDICELVEEISNEYMQFTENSHDYEEGDQCARLYSFRLNTNHISTTDNISDESDCSGSENASENQLDVNNNINEDVFTERDWINVISKRNRNTVQRVMISPFKNNKHDHNNDVDDLSVDDGNEPSVFLRMKLLSLFYFGGQICFGSESLETYFVNPLCQKQLSDELKTSALQSFRNKFVIPRLSNSILEEAKACGSRVQGRSSYFQWKVIDYFPKEGETSRDIVRYIISNFGDPCELGTTKAIGYPYLPPLVSPTGDDFEYFHSESALKGWIFQNHLDCIGSGLAGGINTAFQLPRSSPHSFSPREIGCLMRYMEEKKINHFISQFYESHPTRHFSPHFLDNALREVIKESENFDKLEFHTIIKLKKVFLSAIEDVTLRFCFRIYSSKSDLFYSSLRKLILLYKLDTETSTQNVSDIINSSSLPLSCQPLNWKCYNFENIRSLLLRANTALLMSCPFHLCIIFGGGYSLNGKRKYLLVGRPSGGQAPCGWIPWDYDDIVSYHHLWPSCIPHNPPAKDFTLHYNRFQVVFPNTIYVITTKDLPTESVDNNDNNIIQSGNNHRFDFLGCGKYCSSCYDYKSKTN